MTRERREVDITSDAWHHGSHRRRQLIREKSDRIIEQLRQLRRTHDGLFRCCHGESSHRPWCNYSR